ncbi:MAG: bifunctional adenosylcobinamide kinase/adenosylcobinamide-phosphate guanylyltransferase [Rhodospirillales bacterium]|nr:bifunctional adenosylcobinamide kinase/adenosylcobinamide-phosphate guanylyltransferase [Rhodospirillales bacterium]
MGASPRFPRVTLVLGGARSGKSAYAERLAAGGLYLATAEAKDREMAERIERHKARRGPRWKTVEEPLDIAAVLAEHAAPERPVLVDCLTLWLSNLMAAGRDWNAAVDELVSTLRNSRGPVVLVSNEVGQGVVPANALARAFVDAAGITHQKIAAAADRVVFMTAGIPAVLKETSQ